LAENPANPAEFRRYRQALLVAYVVLGGLAILLIAASVIADLFFTGKERARLPAPSAVDPLRCNHDVRELLEALGGKAAELELDAVKGDGKNLGARWEAFAERWEAEWRAVGARCAFDDGPAESARGPAFERVAWVHRNLIELARKYRGMMARFDEEQAREIARMREALDRSGTSPP
jgi:hypothetical protein